MIYLHTLLGLVFVIGMIMLMGWAIKKAGLEFDAGNRFKGQEGHLKIREALRIDNKRKLVLFSCGQDNFLLMTGDKDFLVSSNIKIDFTKVNTPKLEDEKVLS